MISLRDDRRRSCAACDWRQEAARVHGLLPRRPEAHEDRGRLTLPLFAAAGAVATLCRRPATCAHLTDLRASVRIWLLNLVRRKWLHLAGSGAAGKEAAALISRTSPFQCCSSPLDSRHSPGRDGRLC